jgi:RNA polymerase sigma-70 factor (ECF subfamily)
MNIVFEQHGAFVCRSLSLLGVSEADLDDAIQDVFLVVYRRMLDYEERGRARAWLYSICTRVARSTRRKRSRRVDESETTYATMLETSFAATQLDRITDHEALALGQKLLQRLPPEQRNVFWMYEIEERPMTEIARESGCPLQTAYSRLHKARRRISTEVQRVAARDA